MEKREQEKTSEYFGFYALELFGLYAIINNS